MQSNQSLVVALTLLSVIASCAVAAARDKHFSGIAHWYGPGFHGKRAACGKRFDKNMMTAAHAALPFGTKVLVKSLKTGKSTIVEITDRCAPMKHRVIDLSEGAAKKLGIYPAGSARVECVIVD